MRHVEPALDVEWELNDVAPAAGGEVEVTSPRRGHGGGVIAVVAVVAGAVALLGRLGSSGSDGARPAPAPPPPLVALPTGGTEIDAIVTDPEGHRRLLRVDLGGGATGAAVELGDASVPATVVARRAGRFVTVGAAQPQWVGVANAPTAAGVAGSVLVPAAAADAVWAVGPGPVASLVSAHAGLVTARTTLPANAAVLGDDGTGALVVNVVGEGAVRARPGGPAQVLSDRTVVAVRPEARVEVDCPLAPCSLRHVDDRGDDHGDDRADDTVDLGPVPGLTSHSSLELPLARYRPDGRAVAIADLGGDAGRARLRVVDLDTRTVHTAPVGQRPSELAWTDDGTTLLYLEAGSMWAWHPGGSTTALVLPGVISFSIVPG